jgi:hypothetical protein
MPKLQLESPTDVINLNEIYETGTGIQVTSGVTGLGLPPVSVQWLTGAGDGALYRGQRVQPRNIDLPLDIVGRDRAHLKQLVSRLALALAGACTLALIEDDGTRWATVVYRTGGGEYTYGVDTTGDRDVQMVVTVTAGDPYFTSSAVSTQTIGGDTSTSAWLDSMAQMPVASSQAIGEITLTNPGDAHAYPVWDIYGPGHAFEAVAPSGERLAWLGTLAAGERLTLDTQRGSAVDGTGANRYSDLDTAPRFWSVPPGTTTATASLLGVTSASKIVCSWRARRWVVI